MEQKETKRWGQDIEDKTTTGQQKQDCEGKTASAADEGKATKTRTTEDKGSKTARARQRKRSDETETTIEKRTRSYADRRHFVIGLKNLVIDGGAGTGDGDEEPLGRVGGCVHEVCKQRVDVEISGVLGIYIQEK
jgi:hypothetical protein